MLKNSQQRYGSVAIFFHWFSAAAITGLFVVGLWMVDADYEHDWYDLAFHYHESLGVILALLMLLRWIWRQCNVRPLFSHTLSPIEKTSAITVHRLLYLLCLVIVISGYLIPTAGGRGIDIFTWFMIPSLVDLSHQQVDVAGDIHFWLACILIAFAGLHSLAALKHHFIDKDNTLNNIR